MPPYLRDFLAWQNGQRAVELRNLKAVNRVLCILLAIAAAGKQAVRCRHPRRKTKRA